MSRKRKCMETFGKQFATHFLDHNKPTNKNDEKRIFNEGLEQAEELFCNEGCLHTPYQEGDPNIVPRFYQEWKNKSEPFMKANLPLRRKYRTEAFKHAKNGKILNDSFFRGIPDETVQKAKRMGAISGCNGTNYFLNNPSNIVKGGNSGKKGYTKGKNPRTRKRNR